MNRTFSSIIAHLRRAADSPSTMRAIVIIVALLMFIAIFEAGRTLGFEEAHDVGAWGEHHLQNFEHAALGPGKHSSGHGAEGTIVEVTLPTFTITNRTYPEEQIRVGTATIIRSKNMNVASTTLAVGQQVIVLGAPNAAGEIEAKLIRIMPPKPNSSTSTESMPASDTLNQ